MLEIREKPHAESKAIDLSGGNIFTHNADKVSITDLPTHVSYKLLPLFADDDGPMASIRSGMKFCESTLIDILSHQNLLAKDETRTVTARLIKLRDFANKRWTTLAADADSRLKKTRTDIKLLDAQISEPLAKGATCRHAKETRLVMREMDRSARNAFINESLESNDTDVLGSVLSVPHHLSGLSKSEHRMNRDKYLRVNFPKQLKRKYMLENSAELLTTAAQSVLDRIADLTDNRALAKAEKLRAEIDKG